MLVKWLMAKYSFAPVRSFCFSELETKLITITIPGKSAVELESLGNPCPYIANNRKNVYLPLPTAVPACILLLSLTSNRILKIR